MGEREEAMRWLGRRLAWEGCLDGVRQRKRVRKTGDDLVDSIRWTPSISD